MVSDLLLPVTSVFACAVELTSLIPSNVGTQPNTGVGSQNFLEIVERGVQIPENPQDGSSSPLDALRPASPVSTRPDAGFPPNDPSPLNLPAAELPPEIPADDGAGGSAAGDTCGKGRSNITSGDEERLDTQGSLEECSSSPFSQIAPYSQAGQEFKGSTLTGCNAHIAVQNGRDERVPVVASPSLSMPPPRPPPEGTGGGVREEPTLALNAEEAIPEPTAVEARIQGSNALSTFDIPFPTYRKKKKRKNRR